MPRGDPNPPKAICTLREVSGPEGGESASEGDENPSGPRPNPMDRSWVHPSELSSFVPNPLPEPQARPREWVIGFTSAAVGIAVTLLVLVAFGAFGERNRATIPPPVLTNPKAVVDYGVAVRVSEDVSPSIVTLQSTGDQTVALGSGVAVRSDRVLTSAHFLFGATALSILTADGRTVSAKLVGVDTDTDLALLDVSGANLPYSPLSRTTPTIGEPVVAVAVAKGRPFLDMGIISRQNELAQWSGTTMAGLLQAGVQTSADMSGGALFDADGDLVGILTSPPGITQQGLAVPISAADDVRRQLETSGKVSHGWLGVALVDSRDSLLGAKITSVIANSPADGKLAVGDIVTRAGGEAVTSAGDLIADWRKRTPGDSLSLLVRRNHVDRTINVTLSDDPSKATPPPDTSPDSH
jgi:S1-C subfamily serine protease